MAAEVRAGADAGELGAGAAAFADPPDLDGEDAE
jgi:hypothetical protein